ncbi:fungal-specific transcription factor domain-containing protein [Rhodofomes roseus]|uniref:Fungal-specific transcription factor domain-containing protein n=1 Tax=Rhodofomes roseus TaxID=34475 RepID=A0ABQ8KXJ4_9APHY|nr:fungal-specific transcription factor domain-containing protein [Rhodofomes roseus]KAH9844024.1 fungal-specific transcription factor domain-containing protein [Rhodofomes roseus]
MPEGPPQPTTDSPTMVVHPHQAKKKRFDDDQASADLGLKPVQLQRRRVWRACESCRRKKIKCDGVEPTCSQCSQSKSQCTWLQTKDRAALSRHYVQELEARLLQLEGLFQQVAPILEQVGASGLDLPSIAPSSSSGPDPSSASLIQSVLPQVREVAQSFGAPNGGLGSDNNTPIKVEDDVSESFGQLALDEHGHMHWIGGSSTMSIIQSFLEATSSPLHRISPMEEDPSAPGPSVNKLYFPAQVFFGKVRALPRPEEVEYPDRDLADKLVDAYFARFHFLVPILDKPSFMRRYTYLMDHNNDSELARRQTAFIALVCAVFAVAARFVNDPRLLKADNLDDAGMGMVYYERALILHYISHASTQLEHVQCFILMSSFLCAVNCLPQAWLLVGQAVRSAQDLGLHRSPRRLFISPIEKETRRKVWWGVYTLDRMLALALGRPLGVEDIDCDVELPVDVDDELLPDYFAGATISREPPQLMKGFIDLIQLYRIAGKVLRQVYALDKCREILEPEKRAELQRAVESLDRELTKWCDDLPEAFKSRPMTDKQVSMGAVLCSHYYSILVTLHRNFMPVKYDQPLYPRSTAKAVSTARACIRLAPAIRGVVPPSHHLAFFIQNLFSSAVIILLYAMHTPEPNASQAAMDEATSCLPILEQWEVQWPGARKCKELLEEITATAREAIRTAANNRASVQMRSPTSSASPSGIPEGRMSAAVPMPVPERLIKAKPRRNRSRDPRLSTHQAIPGMQFRQDSQRARSTSRKRPYDDDQFQDGSQGYGLLSSSYPGRSTLSSTSSPASVNSQPSPSGPALEFSDTSPRMVSASAFNPMNIPLPQSPTGSVPSQRFDYDFGLSQSPPDRWTVPEPGGNGLKFFPSGSQQSQSQSSQSQSQQQSQPYSPISYNPSQSSGFESTYLGYDGLSGVDPAVFGMPGSSPPSTNGFAAPGLPFRGLDFIRNYNPAGYAGGSSDNAWHTFDPGAFGYDPEIPFSLGEPALDGQPWQNPVP